MSALADASSRLRVLTDLDSTLLVEAAAGTGKTALMVGRIAMLLARGVEPRAIAAITFTELAASELAARVQRYVTQLLAGRIPESLKLALPDGLSAMQASHLARAADRLEDLTTSTIHAFCQRIIGSYAVESDIDPGARILDAVQAEALFDLVFDQWLKRRLNGPEREGDPVATLSRDDPRRVVKTLRELARYRLEHRGARVLPADFSGRPDVDLVDAVSSFGRWFDSQPTEPATEKVIRELGQLAIFYADSFAATPDFPTLWKLAHPPRVTCMRGQTNELKKPQVKSSWMNISASKPEGAELDAVSGERFDHVDNCYRILLGRIATAVAASLSPELDEVLSDYAAFKRQAAVLDFEDLLEFAKRLVCENEAVTRALGSRYRHILVDEFQDTDPVQAEILFRICAERSSARWQDCELRVGALFMVGDPKQAIYSFRGADIISYHLACDAIRRRWPDNIVRVTENFRSRPAILEHINRCFDAPLSRAGQPGYVPLTPTIDAPTHALPCVAKLPVVAHGANAAELREAEADVVADLCSRLIGNVQVRDGDGAMVPLAPSGIVLLSPGHTDLLRYERALERRGLPIASQAGKNFFKRQEIQDLIALARVLADASDTAAFGALMRGPLVGLTDEELLDISEALPPNPLAPESKPRLTVTTEPTQVGHAHARCTLEILQALRRRARATAPALVIAEAIERLDVRPILATREGDRSARAAANVDAFIERARPYGVRGLKRFVRDIAREWRRGTPTVEGRVDADGECIEILTIHGAKGLEWPVVIPINTATQFRGRDQFVHRRSDNTLHWVIGDVVPPDLLQAMKWSDEAMSLERERLWYVACSRSRELLIIPEVDAKADSWARVADLFLRHLPAFDVSTLLPVHAAPKEPSPNGQTVEVFEAERAIITAAATPLEWRRPSDYDLDRAPTIDTVVVEAGEAAEAEVAVGAGRVRGLVLHKLVEEVISGELAPEIPDLRARASLLLEQLAIEHRDSAALPDPDELAGTIRRTLLIPEIAELLPRLVAEWPVYGVLTETTPTTALAGRIDAVALENGRPSLVIDWKSDVAPTDRELELHLNQMVDYLVTCNAQRGALVYMSSGLVRFIERPVKGEHASAPVH